MPLAEVEAAVAHARSAAGARWYKIIKAGQLTVDDDTHDLIRAFQNAVDTQIAQNSLEWVILQVAIAPYIKEHVPAGRTTRSTPGMGTAGAAAAAATPESDGSRCQVLVKQRMRTLLT
jgi:hypothetical protein